MGGGQADLVYLDPPFNSKTNYNVLFGKKTDKSTEWQAFSDTWQWNEEAAERVALLSQAVAHPAHSAILGLKQLLGESGMLAYLSYMAD